MRVSFGVSAMSKSRNRSSRDDKSVDTIDPIENELRRMAGNGQARLEIRRDLAAARDERRKG